MKSGNLPDINFTTNTERVTKSPRAAGWLAISTGHLVTVGRFWVRFGWFFPGR
jgi:hypothetical protein